jgi:hypothetical protein
MVVVIIRPKAGYREHHAYGLVYSVYSV